MTEQELLRDCLVRLNRIGATYMLTGSMASNAWGIPRTTHDLDFVIQLAPSNINRLVDAFHPDYFIDEQGIVAVQQGRLDDVYLRKWGQDLGLQDLLEEALAGRMKPKDT